MKIDLELVIPRQTELDELTIGRITEEFEKLYVNKYRDNEKRPVVIGVTGSCDTLQLEALSQALKGVHADIVIIDDFKNAVKSTIVPFENLKEATEKLEPLITRLYRTDDKKTSWKYNRPFYHNLKSKRKK